MAENLGEAQLRLTVDTGAVDKELKRLRDAIQNFAPDFKAVKAGLRTVSVEAKAAADAAKSLAFNLNQVPSSKLEGLGKQIKALQTNLRGARIQSEDFLKALTRIQELEGLRDIRVGRQSALAGQQAYSPDGAFGQLDQSQLPQLPLTLAGERQNIDELKQKLSNLDYESAAYGETLRVLQRAQERYNNILNGTSAEYQKLAQQEEAAIRRAEKLAGIQSYYADRNPRAGGVRNESGAMLARGAGSVSDERAYQAALRPARELLETDLKREQVLRQISQRILATAQASEGGFGAASASNFGTTDPVAKSIRRNAERSAQRLEALAAQRESLESDLADVQHRRLRAEERSLKAIERGREIGRLNAVGIDGRLPGGGFAPGSPGARAVRARQLNEAGGNALIGGAFPLLFGQGLGASIGGGLGGAIGGLAGGQFGFGASLVGTAIGSAVDALNTRFGELAVALLSPVESFNKLKEASVSASRAQDGYIQALIDSGRTAQAAQVIQREAGKTIDPANALLLAGSTDVLNRAFSDLQDRLGSFTAGAGQAFNTWVARLIRTVAGAPGQNQPLTGPQATRNAQNQRATGAGIGTLGLGVAIAGATLLTGGAALAVGGAGLAAAGVGFGSAFGANDSERVATSQEVAAAEEKVRSLLAEQVTTQQNINQAKALGLTKTAELIGLTNQFQAAQVTAANQELQIQAQLAAGQITQSEASKQLADAEAARRITVEALVAKQQEAAAIAAVELQSAQALVGLKGQQRTIAQEQLKQEAAITQYIQARAAYEDRRASGLASPEELQALKAAANEAGTKLQTAMITGSQAIKNASEDARKNFESAAKALQTTAESNFKFLTKGAQQEVLKQARQDIAAGVQSGNIDQKFLRARKPEDVIAAANASRSQIQALDNFNKAAQEYSSAVSQSNQTLGTVSKQLPDVSNNIVALQGSLDGLASKDWSVNVSVTGDSAANVRVD